jgi:hypothetical protein
MPAPTCRGASVATSAVLGCPSSYRSPHLEVTTGTFGGSAAVVLVTRQTVSTADGDLRIERRLALDPTTFFPIGSDESDTLVGDLTTRRSSLHSVISHDFVPYGGLARDFFTASATTVSDDRQLDAAARGDTLYWLGRTLAPSGSYPALALWRIEPGPTSSSPPTGVGPPRYRAIVRYRPTSDPSGPPTVAIFTWSPDDWARVHGIPTAPCVGAPPPPDLGVPVAVSCSVTDVEAVVVYPDAVVHLIASGPTERGQSANPYAAPNGMALLLRALQPRT